MEKVIYYNGIYKDIDINLKKQIKQNQACLVCITAINDNSDLIYLVFSSDDELVAKFKTKEFAMEYANFISNRD